MTKEELHFLLEAKREFEFEYKGKTFSFMCGVDPKGKSYIDFGTIFIHQRYSSFEDLYAHAEIGNTYFREIIPEIEISEK